VAVLEIVHPLALVACAIHVDVDTLPVGLVVHPVSLIDISVDVREFPEPVRSVVFPVAFVASPIRPDLFTVAVTETTNPLACKLGSSRVLICRSLLPLSVWVVGHV
jgi:hypothetical protein